MNQDNGAIEHGGTLRRIVDSILRVLPDAYEKIPSEADRSRARQESLDNIVRRHAEGSVLLSAGQYVIDGDLLADDGRPDRSQEGCAGRSASSDTG